VAVAGQSDADLTRASAARVRDWLLGGTLNTPIDRFVGRQIESVLPSIRQLLHAGRAFLRLAAAHMLERGIRQFLELGPGFPMAGQVHQLIQERQLDATVVYVDRDPAVVGLGESALRGVRRAAFVHADLLQPHAVLDHEETRRLIDLAEPVGLLMIEVLQTVPDEARPGQLVNAYRKRLCSGSGLALSHVAPDLAPQYESFNAAHGALFGRVVPRDHEVLSSWLSGLELVEPGLAPLSDLLPSEYRPVGQGDDPLRHTLAAIGYER
jgi:hypothetical protein